MTTGMFFTTQRLTGADVFVCYDRTLHKFWVVVINSVYKWVQCLIHAYLVFSWLIFQQAKYVSGLWN